MQLEIRNFPKLDYACEEAINTLCTNLSFCGKEQNRIMITSYSAHEGKTFIAMNILRAMAALGKRVVFVDADMRRSMVVNCYGVTAAREIHNGLVNYLAGMCAAEEILYTTDILNADLIPVGRTISNPLTLLSGERFSGLVNALSSCYDVVIIDAPPVGMVIDAVEIAKFCTGTLFVVKYNETSRRELLDAKRQIERTGCAILGAVLNRVSFDSYSSKKYYNKKYYSNYTSDYYKPAGHGRKKTER